jgi:hypothetical protein
MPPELAAHIRRAAAEPFVWGAADCTTLASDWCLALTGIDPMRGWRDRYTSALGWARLRAGLPEGLAGAASAALRSIGWQTVTPAEAPDGAIGIVETTHGDAMAIRAGEVWLCHTGDGLWRVPVATMAWRVPAPFA